jgi:hypothetical protein
MPEMGIDYNKNGAYKVLKEDFAKSYEVYVIKKEKKGIPVQAWTGP